MLWWTVDSGQSKKRTGSHLLRVLTNLEEEAKRCFRLLETDCFRLGFWSLDGSAREMEDLAIHSFPMLVKFSLYVQEPHLEITLDKSMICQMT